MLNHTFLLVARVSPGGHHVGLVSGSKGSMKTTGSGSQSSAAITLFEDGSAWADKKATLSVQNGYVVFGRQGPGIWTNLDGILAYNGTTSFWQCPGGSIAWCEHSVCWGGERLEVKLEEVEGPQGEVEGAQWGQGEVEGPQGEVEGAQWGQGEAEESTPVQPEESRQDAPQSAPLVYQRAADNSVPANATSSAIITDSQSSASATSSAGLIPELTDNAAPQLSLGLFPLAQLAFLL